MIALPMMKITSCPHLQLPPQERSGVTSCADDLLRNIEPDIERCLSRGLICNLCYSLAKMRIDLTSLNRSHNSVSTEQHTAVKRPAAALHHEGRFQIIDCPDIMQGQLQMKR